MRLSPSVATAVVLLTALFAPQLVRAQTHSCALDSVCLIEGEVPEEGESFRIPFEVPAGAAEIEVRHDDLSDANVLDWGLEDPDGFRGYGGGNTEPAVVAEEAASRSYLPGPITAGTWNVTVGKAKIGERPARYELEIEVRSVATLEPQPERAPYAESPPLVTEGRWYAGDFHVHSSESGDAHASFDEIAQLARAQGLDFVMLSEHNTVSQLEFYNALQADYPDLLWVPGVEFTTYSGHANGLGATEYVDPRIDIEDAIAQFQAQDALFSINHPSYDVSDMCLGCVWEHPLPVGGVDAVEVATGGWQPLGFLFTEPAIAFWDHLASRGERAAVIGGSDDHRAGVGMNYTHSPIGEPTTLVWAEELSVPALMQGVRDGLTVVKLQGPEDPMVELHVDLPRTGDSVYGAPSELTVTVTPGLELSDALPRPVERVELRLVHNGVPLEPVSVTGYPFVYEHAITAPTTGMDRWRAEVLIDGRVRTLTSHVWVATDASQTEVNNGAPPVASMGCAAGDAASGPSVLWALGVLGVLAAGTRASRRRIG